MWKTLIGSAALLALVAGPANAASFADIGDNALFAFTGFAEPNPDPVVVGTSDITLSAPNTIISGTEEFEGLEGFTPTFVNPFILPTTTGDITDQSFTVDFDRSQVTDPAGASALGAQTGTLTFTLTDIQSVTSQSDELGTNITLTGLLSVAQTSGTPFYDPATGDFRINADFPLLGNEVFTLTAGVPSLTPIPVPAALPLLATALGGLGFLSWRRKKQDSA